MRKFLNSKPVLLNFCKCFGVIFDFASRMSSEAGTGVPYPITIFDKSTYVLAEVQLNNKQGSQSNLFISVSS